jgi:hypothetical protein
MTREEFETAYRRAWAREVQQAHLAVRARDNPGGKQPLGDPLADRVQTNLESALEAITKAERPLSARSVAERTGLPERAARNALAKLAQRGYVVRTSTTSPACQSGHAGVSVYALAEKEDA